MNSHFKRQTSALLSLFLPETHGAPLPDTPEQSEEVDDDDDAVDGDDDADANDDDDYSVIDASSGELRNFGAEWTMTIFY